MRYAATVLAFAVLGCQDKPPAAVPMRPLAEGWSMPFDTRFKRQDTGSELVFLRPGTTFHVTFYEIGADETIDQAIQMQAKGIKETVEQTFEHQAGPMKGKAFTYPFTYQGQKVWTVHTFMGCSNSLVEVTFYLQFKDHIPWAIGTWKGLKFR